MSEDRRLALDGDAYGEWLHDVYEALGLSRAALLGVSWGGFVALNGATVAPQRVSALVLLVPAGVVAGSAWAGFTKVGWPMLLYRLTGSQRQLRRLFDGLFTTRDERWATYFGDALVSYRMDVRVPPLTSPERAASYERPVLVFGADDDVHFPGGKLLARVKELFPRAETEPIPGSKHCPPQDDTFRERLASRVDAFLRAAPP